MRVLLITGGPLDFGGISSYMFNYLHHIDKDRVRFDFVVHGEEQGPREQEALSYGAKVYHVPHRRQGLLKNARALKAILASGNYDIVHAHLDGMNGYALWLAKKAGIPVRVAHCHNTRHLTRNPLRMLLHRLTSLLTLRVATQLFACSGSAAQFFYGRRAIEKGRVTIIKNAIALEQFRFDPVNRTKLRAELGLKDSTFVVGQVGRFEYQKNHAFLLDAFYAFHKRVPDSALLLLGDGVLRGEIEAKIRSLNLTDAVQLLGYRENAASYYSAFDLFALPSHFEGLGIVLIEAEMAGLPCLCSDAVPTDAQVRDCTALPLQVSSWVAAMEQAYRNRHTRISDPAPLMAAGFDIDTEAKKLQAFYEALKQ